MLDPRAPVFLSLCFSICLSNVCRAQNTVDSDSSYYQRQLELFDAAVGIGNTEIINGRKYNPPINVSGSHPFYNSSAGATGTLTFRGMPYFNLTLLYDIYSDELVVQQHRPTGLPDWIMLNKGSVESFKVHDHTFKKYHGATAQVLGIADGFYDVLYKGTAFTIIAKRKKATKVDLGRVVFESEDRYLLIQPGKSATPFRGMKSFYNMLNEKSQKAELRSLVKQRHLNVKKNDYDLTIVSERCDAIQAIQK